MGYNFEYEIIIGVIIGIIFIILFWILLLDKFFPKNKISEKLEKIIDWIIYDIRI